MIVPTAQRAAFTVQFVSGSYRLKTDVGGSQAAGALYVLGARAICPNLNPVLRAGTKQNKPTNLLKFFLICCYL
jgi:hypothetical protein